MTVHIMAAGVLQTIGALAVVAAVVAVIAVLVFFRD